MTPTLSVRFQCSTTAVVSPASLASVNASTGAALVFHTFSTPGRRVAYRFVRGPSSSARTANGLRPATRGGPALRRRAVGEPLPRALENSSRRPRSMSARTISCPRPLKGGMRFCRAERTPPPAPRAGDAAARSSSAWRCDELAVSASSCATQSAAKRCMPRRRACSTGLCSPTRGDDRAREGDPRPRMPLRQPSRRIEESWAATVSCHRLAASGRIEGEAAEGARE